MAGKNQSVFIGPMGRRQGVILLVGLCLLACTSLVVVGLLVMAHRSRETGGLGGNPLPTVVITVTPVPLAGLTQYPVAEAAALAWAGDAQLVSASAAWSYVLSLDQLRQPTRWTYRFYSPANERLFFVVIEPDGQMHTIIHTTQTTLPPRPIATDAWVIDSSTALTIWLDNNGAKMLQTNPGLELLMQLRSRGDNANPVWSVIGLDKRTEDIHAVIIDATQGVITTITPKS